MRISLAEGKKCYQEVRLGLGQHKAPLVYSYSWPDSRDAASLEQTTKVLQQRVLSYSCCHEGGRDPAAPLGSRGLDKTHLRQPWRQVGRRETLDEEEDDAAEEEICLGFFTLVKGAYL
jgi:hypothetical protein